MRKPGPSVSLFNGPPPISECRRDDRFDPLWSGCGARWAGVQASSFRGAQHIPAGWLTTNGGYWADVYRCTGIFRPPTIAHATWALQVQQWRPHVR